MANLTFLVFLIILFSVCVWFDHRTNKNIRKFHVVSDNFRKHPGVDITLPTRGTERSAGYDIYSPETIVIPPGRSVKIYTDVKVSMSKRNVFELYPRSSTAIKKDLTIKNVVGIIDSDYFSNIENDGNLILCIENNGSIEQVIEKGERFAQGIFKYYLTTVNDRPLSKIRTGGVGSTGSK